MFKQLLVTAILCLAIAAQASASQSLAPTSPLTRTSGIGAVEIKDQTFYVARYERYGLLGLYHVSLAVDVVKNGVSVQKLHIDGAGRLPQYNLSIGPLKFNFRIPPVYLAGAVNPRGYKKHFLGLLDSNEFGPSYKLSERDGVRLVSMAHHAITELDHNKQLFYSTCPIHIGALDFWTSNSVVASLVAKANKEGINLPKPKDGIYPGFDGPFLPDSLYEYNQK